MTQYILTAQQISKAFGGVQALDKVDFFLNEGEIHALLGENGAGKSTLIKILSGAHKRDEGNIIYNGKELVEFDAYQARHIGINTVYQELMLIEDMPVYQNIFLGYEKGSGLVDDKFMIDKSIEILEQLDIDINVKLPVRNFNIATKQMVEIGRALLLETKILIMDEPTSSLSKKETQVLFAKLKEIASSGVSVLYISHRLEEIFEICNRVTVMRDGKIVDSLAFNEVTGEEQLVRLMIGKKLDALFPDKNTVLGDEILSIKNLSREKVFEDVSFSLRKGEVFGIGGLVGSKRSEIVESIFGLFPPSKGSVYLEGKKIAIKSPKDAINLGFGLLTEDRKGSGVFMDLTVKENISMTILEKLKSRLGLINKQKELQETDKYVDLLSIKTPTVEQLISKLSGGNQQKTLIARWVLTNPKILIMDEPTRGIDVNAKSEIYSLMSKLTKEGISIIMISSELPELIAMSDTIMVMREGRIAGFLSSTEEKTEENVLRLAFGGAK